MAEMKSIDELVTIVFGAIAEYHVDADKIFPVVGVQMKVHPDVNAEEFQRALDHMSEQGWIRPAREGFAFLTEAGFDRM